MLDGNGDSCNTETPPSPPQSDGKIPQGNASSAVQFLRSNSNDVGKPNVVSVGLDI